LELEWVGRDEGHEASSCKDCGTTIGGDNAGGMSGGISDESGGGRSGTGERTVSTSGGSGLKGRRALARKSRRRYEKLQQDPLAQALVTRLARKHRVSLRDLTQGGRGSGNASHTRQMAMYLCYVLLRRTQEQLGVLFNRDRKTVSHACAQIELLRETDRALDRELTGFETEGWVEAARRDRELSRDAA